MKKLIKFFTLVLLVVCTLSFVACNDNNNNDAESNSGVKDAVTFLKGSYASAEDHTSSYTLPSVVRVNGVAYQVSWSIKYNAGGEDMVKVVAPQEAGADYTIEYNSEITVETKYELTLTVTDAEGNEESLTFRERVAKVPAPLTAVQFAKEKDGVSCKAAGYVVNIIYNGYYIQDETGRILVYKPSSYPTLGQYVVVKGSKGSYSGAHQFATGSEFTVDETKAALTASQITEKYAAEKMENVAAALAVDKEKNINKAMVISGVLAANGSYNYDVTDATGTLTIANINNDYSSQLKEAIGKNVTLTVSVYSNSAYTYVINSITASELTDAERVAAAKASLEALVADYDGKSDLPTSLNGATVSYAETTDPATNALSADGKVKASATEDVTVNAKATITCGSESAEADVTITIAKQEPIVVPTTPLASAVKLVVGKELAVGDNGSYMNWGFQYDTVTSLNNGFKITEFSSAYVLCTQAEDSSSGMLGMETANGIRLSSGSKAGYVVIASTEGYFNTITFNAASWTVNTATITFTATVDGVEVVKTVDVQSTEAKTMLADVFTVSFEGNVTSVKISSTSGNGRCGLQDITFSYVAPQA